MTIAVMMAVAVTAQAQTTVQYRSTAGVEYRSQQDTGSVARAQAALNADPQAIQRYIALGVAQSGIRQFREAIETFTRGLARDPDNAMLLRWRGHRYLSTRQFDLAAADLERAAKLDSTIYGIWYHWGIVRFARGDFNGAAQAFVKALPIAPNGGELNGSVDWLWMSLSRAGRAAEAKALLDRKPDTTSVKNAYSQRIAMYRGLTPPAQLVTPADTADVQASTLSFGLGNWYLIQGETTKARAAFEGSIAAGGWPGFGFILSEIELKRLR
ncbi:MAG: tetratricopeptide repeat protein [Gemmatimonadota bacterium]